MKKVIITLIVVVTFLIVTTDVGDIPNIRNTNISRNIHYLDIKTPLSLFSLGSGNSLEVNDENKPKTPPNAQISGNNASIRKALVDYVYSQIGKQYSWGAIGPNKFDCSGLTFSAYKSQGKNIVRTTRQMWDTYKPIPYEQAQPGDLILVQGHVGMYVGNGKLVEAAGINQTGEVKENLVSNKWWQDRKPVFINVLD